MKKDPGSHPLYDYIFHYNPYTELWSAFKKEDKENYFNGEAPRNEIIKAKKIQDLISWITTTQTNGGKKE